MEKKLRILLLEDSIDDVILIEHLLKKESLLFSSRIVETKEEYVKQLLQFRPDVVISDHSLPQFNSRSALDLFLEYRNNQHHTAAFVLVTGTVSEEFAVDIIQSGADDYILKDRLKRLPSAILNAVEKNRLKEQRRKIEEERHYLLDMLQKSLHEIYVIHPDTLLFEYANGEALKNLGYSMAELSTMTPADVIYDFDETAHRSMFFDVENTPKGKIYDRYAIRKDNTKYPVQIHMQVIQQGENKKVLANILDITETKEHEQQKELALFIQNSFNENRSLEASLEIILKELCTRSGIPAAEIWSKDFEEKKIRCYAVWNEQNEELEKAGRHFADQVFKTGKPVQYENLQEANFLKNNELPMEKDSFVGTMAYPIRSGNEITAVIVVYAREIIKKKDPFINLKEGVQDKLAENIKRKKTEEELLKIFELSPDALIVAGKDGYFKKINPAFQKILGFSYEELLSRPIVEFLHRDDRLTVKEWQNSISKENEVSHYETRYLTATGKYRWFAWSVTPFLKEELGYAIGKDITAFKEQVRAIQRQNERLSEIAWEQSHVVRAPLTRLMACVAYLEEEEFREDRDAVLKSIKASAYELDEIVKTIVSKTEQIKKNEEY